MVPRISNRFVRILRAVPVVTCLFAGCTCAGTPAPIATPTATTRPAATATSAPPPTDPPPPPPTAENPPPPADAAPPPAAPPAQSAPDAAKRAACESYVAVLSGRKQDAALLGKPEVKAIASSDLVMCGAVRSDSDAMCKQFMPLESGPGPACLHMQGIFHELRAYPGKHSFMVDEFDWTDCRAIPGIATYCDTLRETLRSGNEADCARVGDGQSVCRAYMKLDGSLCRVTGKLAEMEIELPDRKEGEPAKVKPKSALEESCRKNIESRAFLAKGLKAIAESGPPLERELAKAALGQADACETYAQVAMEACLAGSPAPAPAGAGSQPPPPPPPAPNAPPPPPGNSAPSNQGRG